MIMLSAVNDDDADDDVTVDGDDDDSVGGKVRWVLKE